jgi:hypothetical protein
MSKKRPREYLTEAEIERLMSAAKANRHGHRDATAILVAYRHALRSSELVTLDTAEDQPNSAASGAALCAFDGLMTIPNLHAAHSPPVSPTPRAV